MSVRTFDSPLRFFVASDSRAKLEHLVELDAYNGNSSCMCEDFQFRCRPLLDLGERGRHLRCKHILAAREHLLDKIIATIAQQQKEKEKPKRGPRSKVVA